MSASESTVLSCSIIIRSFTDDYYGAMCRRYDDKRKEFACRTPRMIGSTFCSVQID